jgi:hypothetical protein
MFVTVPFKKGVINVVIEVKFITADPVLKVVMFHHSSLTVSWTTKQHPPVMDADDEEDVEVADVVFEKNDVAGLKSAILLGIGKCYLHLAGVVTALAQIVTVTKIAIRLLRNILKEIMTTVLEQYEKKIDLGLSLPCGSSPRYQELTYEPKQDR